MDGTKFSEYLVTLHCCQMSNSFLEMAAVVRLKRLIEDEPSEALVINCKRRKTEESEPLDQPLPTVLKFACTVEDQVRVLEHNLKNFLISKFFVLECRYFQTHQETH